MVKVKSKVTRFKIWSENGRTDERTEAIALPPVLTRSVITIYCHLSMFVTANIIAYFNSPFYVGCRASLMSAVKTYGV